MSWRELLAIAEEAKAEDLREETTAPSACPHDGEPLRTDPDGELRCPWCGWVSAGANLKNYLN